VNAINAGKTLVNFYGHGTLQAWTGQPPGGIFRYTDAANLTNTKLSVFLMMTCLDGDFSEVFTSGISLSEALLLNPHGAVAAWASTGVTTPADQINADEKATAEALDGETLGKAMVDAKAFITDPYVRETWVLLGDPAMTLR